MRKSDRGPQQMCINARHYYHLASFLCVWMYVSVYACLYAVMYAGKYVGIT